LLLFRESRLKPNYHDKGRDKLQSPDFQWIQHDKKNISQSIFRFFSERISTDITNKIGPKGLYIYGSVGTGKSMIMDLFYNTIPITRKRRVHFHAFMQDIHARVHAIKIGQGLSHDPIPTIADDLSNEAWLLCFDEFQVTDIADAMLLRRLLEELFKRGVVMVTTSNRHPDELYKNGIQRQSFLPAIANIKECCNIHSLDSGVDYRQTSYCLLI
jgi:protein AFG1